MPFATFMIFNISLEKELDNMQNLSRKLISKRSFIKRSLLALAVAVSTSVVTLPATAAVKQTGKYYLMALLMGS